MKQEKSLENYEKMKYHVESYQTLKDLNKRIRFLLIVNRCTGILVEKDLKRVTWQEKPYQTP